VSLETGDDARVPGDLSVPAASGGVVAERGEAGEPGPELRDELGGGDVAVASLANAGVWACSGGELAGARLADPGLEHLGAQSFGPAGDDGLAVRGDGQCEPGPGLAHRFFAGGADGAGGQGSVAQVNLGTWPSRAISCLRSDMPALNWLSRTCVAGHADSRQ